MPIGLPGPLFATFAEQLAKQWPDLHTVALFSGDPLAELERRVDVAIVTGNRPWELMPAQMKGFIDKVIFPGLFYRYQRGGTGMAKLSDQLRGVTMVTTMNTSLSLPEAPVFRVRALSRPEFRTACITHTGE